MRQQIHTTLHAGYCLLELLVVLMLLGICVAGATASVATGLSRQEARGAAQTWQAAAGWAQVGVLWQGGSTELDLSSRELSVSHDLDLCGGDLGASAPTVAVSANVPRWRTSDGVAVGFSGGFASPDSGGSLYFLAFGGAYRVVVRPESGLTARTWVKR
jgi:prepilin-type N-terminal cleavage/methylation domain-containing protein